MKSNPADTGKLLYTVSSE